MADLTKKEIEEFYDKEEMGKVSQENSVDADKSNSLRNIFFAVGGASFLGLSASAIMGAIADQFSLPLVLGFAGATLASLHAGILAQYFKDGMDK